MTCQRRKGNLSPAKWAIKQRIYRKWDAREMLTAEECGMLFKWKEQRTPSDAFYALADAGYPPI
jgi:hypothetical protein